MGLRHSASLVIPIRTHGASACAMYVPCNSNCIPLSVSTPYPGASHCFVSPTNKFRFIVQQAQRRLRTTIPREKLMKIIVLKNGNIVTGAREDSALITMCTIQISSATLSISHGPSMPSQHDHTPHTRSDCNRTSISRTLAVPVSYMCCSRRIRTVFRGRP